MTEHVVGRGTYFGIFGLLMVLLAATIGVAYIHLGEWNVVAAITIAVLKAILIILYFMHVRNSSRLIWVFIGAGFFWLLILFVLALTDYWTRAWLPLPTGWE